MKMEKCNKTRRGWQVGLALFALTIGPASYAADLPEENRLPNSTDYGFPAIGFDNVDISYKPGKTKRKIVQDTQFFAEGHTSSGASLSVIAPGYLGSGVLGGTNFNGDFIIDAFISPKGTFKNGTFGFWSNDAMFDVGQGTVDYDCNKAGNNCSNGFLVYGGDLLSFGWSSSTVLGFTDPDTAGMLEFGIGNQSGWAWDLWKAGGPEHILLDIYEGLNIADLNSVTEWTGTAKGIAIVPVPAAVWLFGSGLLGLMGVMKRKRA